jgi:hypothetical protein
MGYLKSLIIDVAHAFEIRYFDISFGSGEDWQYTRALNSGDYEARVRVRNTYDQVSQYSDVVHFTILLLEKPTFTVDASKEEKAVFSGNYNNGARAFLEVTRISNGTINYYELNINPPYNWKLEEILSGGDYSARMRVRNVDDQMSRYSDVVYFTVDAKPAHEDDEEEPVTPPTEPPVTPPTEPPVTPPTEPPVTPPGTPILSPVDTGVKTIKDAVSSGSKAVKNAAVAIGKTIANIYQSEAVQNFQKAIEAEPARVAIASMAGIATAAVPMALQLDSFGTLFSALRNGLGLAFLKRKRKQWGMVYNATTGKPIPGVLVSVFNEDGRKLDAVSTDKYGAYAFLVSPGKYRLEAQKEGFKFVPNDKTAKTFYADNYNGEYLEVKEDDLIRANISLVAEQVTEEKTYRQYLFYIFQVIFYGGFIFSIYAAITTLSILNITVFIMYAVSGLVNEAVLGKVKWGKTILPNGKDASFTYIKVRNKETGELISKVISDNSGRYYLILNPGKYDLEAVAVNGSRWSGDIDVKERKVINKKIKLQQANAVLADKK